MSEGAPKAHDAPAADDLGAEIASQRVSRRTRVTAAVSRCVATKTYGDTVTRAELMGWFSLVLPAVGTKREFDRVDLLFAALKAYFDEARRKRGGRKAVSP